MKFPGPKLFIFLTVNDISRILELLTLKNSPLYVYFANDSSLIPMLCSFTPKFSLLEDNHISVFNITDP